MRLTPPQGCSDCTPSVLICWEANNNQTCQQTAIDTGSFNGGVTMSLNELMPLLLAILSVLVVAKLFNILIRFLWSNL